MASAKHADGLSEQERRFVEAYMGPANGNATKAARLAGYSAKTAGSQASRLLKRVNVRKAVAKKVANDPVVADRERRQRFWTAVMDASGRFKQAEMKDRLKASELLGKSQGDFVEKHEHEHEHEHTGKDGGPIETRVTFGGRYKPGGGAKA